MMKNCGQTDTTNKNKCPENMLPLKLKLQYN